MKINAPIPFIGLISSGIFILSSCQPQDKLAHAQKELQAKKQELTDLEKVIDTLQNYVARLDTTIEVITPTKVKVQTVQTRVFKHFINATGTVTSKENLLLSAKVPGEIMAINVNEGEQVSKGVVLAVLDNEALQNQLGEARAALSLAETIYNRRKKLWDQKIGSEIEYLQAQTNYESAKKRLAQLQANYDNSFIKAPISGTIDRISANEGEFVGVGAPLMRIINLARPEIEVELSEKYLTAVSTQDSVTVNIPALSLSQRVPIDFVSNFINPENRSFAIKVVLKNPQGAIKPNLLANVTINDYQSDEALVVPSRAIQKDLEGDYLYVAKTVNGRLRAIPRRIEKGRSYQNTTEILSGLEPGDQVITTGYGKLSAQQVIRIES